MDVTIRPKNFKLTRDVETHIRKRIDRLPRHLENLATAEVILSQERTHLTANRVQYRAQLTLHTRNNSLIRSEVSNPELLTAIDEALNHVSRRIERVKGRYDRKRKHKTGVGKSSAEMITS